MPYGEKIYDKKKSELLENPKRESQTELNKQIFCLYDFQHHIFYISSLKRKAFIQEYLTKKLSKNIAIKNFYKTPEEFVENIKTINSISLTSRINLLNQSIFDSKPDTFGLGEPEVIKLFMGYNNRNITNIFKNLFSNFFKENKDTIESLVCIGKDDKKMEHTFNISSFIKKISIKIEKDEHGKYKENDAQQKLLNKLKKLCTKDI